MWGGPAVSPPLHFWGFAPFPRGLTCFLNRPFRHTVEADMDSRGEELIETRLKSLLRLLESCFVSKHVEKKDHTDTLTRSKRVFFF